MLIHETHYMTLAVFRATYKVVVSQRSEKFRSERVSIADLCDGHAMLHQLSYQANGNWSLYGLMISPNIMDIDLDINIYIYVNT